MHTVFFIDRKFVYLYSYVIGWFPQKTNFLKLSLPKRKKGKVDIYEH